MLTEAATSSRPGAAGDLALGTYGGRAERTWAAGTCGTAEELWQSEVLPLSASKMLAAGHFLLVTKTADTVLPWHQAPGWVWG